MSEIAPLSVLTVQDIIRRQNDLVIAVDEIKAIAKRERYDLICEVLREYNSNPEGFEEWLNMRKLELV